MIAPASLTSRDRDRVGLVDDGPHDVFEHGGRRRGEHAVAVVAHFALAALNSAHAPEISSSFCTRSVGWAPSFNHRSALALSMLTTDGSLRGLYWPTISKQKWTDCEKKSLTNYLNFINPHFKKAFSKQLSLVMLTSLYPTRKR